MKMALESAISQMAQRDVSRLYRHYYFLVGINFDNIPFLILRAAVYVHTFSYEISNTIIPRTLHYFTYYDKELSKSSYSNVVP